MLVVSNWHLFTLIRTLSKPKSLKDSIYVELLVEVDRPVLPVTDDSYAKDLTNLPQILSSKSTRQFLIEPVDLALTFGSSKYVVDVDQKLYTSFSVNKYI